MKKIYSGIIALIILLLFSNQIWSQTGNNNIRIGGILTHYINNEKYKLNGPFEGYYTYTINPGIEAVYFKKINVVTMVGSGINFQPGRVSSYMSGLRRFHFNEITVPVILQRNIVFNEKILCYFSTGIYAGIMQFKKAENPNSAGAWHEWAVTENLENYSNDIFLTDLYLDSGYSKSISKSGSISFSAFVKYRINPTWLNYHQKKIHYGIKLNYNLNL